MSSLDPSFIASAFPSFLREVLFLDPQTSTIDFFFSLQATQLWETYSKNYRTRFHEEEFRGYVNNDLEALVQKQSQEMDEFQDLYGWFADLMDRLNQMVGYLNHAKPEFVMEAMEETVTEATTLTVERNDGLTYNGPFADLEEERFYRVTPNLEELMPSLFLKKKKSVEEESEEEKEEEDEKEEWIEREIEAMEEQKEEEEEYEDEEEEERVRSPTHSVPLADIPNLTNQQKCEIVMDRLLDCFSAKEIDEVGD